MNKTFYCPHCGEHSLVRDLPKPYYVELNIENWGIEYGETEYEPKIEDSETRMYCEVCWDFVDLDELDEQIESFKKDKKIAELEKSLRKAQNNE